MSTEDQLQALHASLSSLDVASALRSATMLAAMRKEWLYYNVFDMHLMGIGKAPPQLPPEGAVRPNLKKAIAEMTVADRTVDKMVLPIPADEIFHIVTIGKRAMDSGTPLSPEFLEYYFRALRVETQIKNRISSFIIRALTDSQTSDGDAPHVQSISRMTGLPNLDQFTADLEKLFEDGFSFPVVHAFIDIDDFKRINTDIGHDEADKIIVAVSKSMFSTLLYRGQLYHRSGDEFLVLLANYTLEEARLLLERLRKEVESLELPHNVSATVSIGAAASSAHIRSATEIREAANRANREAKGRGKNQICISESVETR